MIRVKRGVVAKSKHKKWLDAAKGFYGRSKNCYRVARRVVEKAMTYNYVHRKLLKRDMRRAWILRINAAARECGIRYSEFMHTLTKHMNIDINRKMLAYMVTEHADNFKTLVLDVIKYRETHGLLTNKVMTFSHADIIA